jgi:hypothetical protein
VHRGYCLSFPGSAVISPRQTRSTIVRLQPILVGILVSTATWCLAACGPAEAPHPISADPHTLVIALADLPGWQMDAPNMGPIRNPRDLIGDSSDVSPYTDNGWVRGYEADFVSSSKTGAQAISVLISVFANPGGAQSFFMQGIGGQDPGGQAMAHAPALGERSKIFLKQVDKSSDTNGSVWYWFYWQDRNVLARVLVKGPATAESDAVRIAQREAQILQQY